MNRVMQQAGNLSYIRFMYLHQCTKWHTKFLFIYLLLVSITGKANIISTDPDLPTGKKAIIVGNAGAMFLPNHLVFDSSVKVVKPSKLSPVIGNCWSISGALIFNRQSIGTVDIARTYGFYKGCMGIFGRSCGLGIEQNLRHTEAKSICFFTERFFFLFAARFDVVKDISVNNASNPWRIRFSLGLTGIYYGDIMFSYTLSTVQNDPYKQGFGITFRARGVYKRANWEFKG